MNGAGEPNIVQNIQHQGLTSVWHFVYFGYSRTEKRAFAFVQLKNGPVTLDYPSVNQYLVEKLFFLIRDSRYSNYNGV